MRAVVLSFVFILAGFLSGTIYSIFSLLRRASKNIIVTFVTDLVWCILAGFVYILCVFKVESGDFAFFETLCFAFGIVFEIIFVQNIFASFGKWVYNHKHKKGEEQ